jgi:hypothetical protein
MLKLGSLLDHVPSVRRTLAEQTEKGLLERHAPTLEKLETAKKYALPAALTLGGLYTAHKIHQGVKHRREQRDIQNQLSDLRAGQMALMGAQQPSYEPLQKYAAGGAGVPATPSSIKPASAKQSVTGKGRIIPTSTPQPPSGGAAQGFRQIPPSATEASQRPTA